MVLTSETLEVIKQFYTDKKAYKKTLSTYGWLIGLKHLNENSTYRVGSKKLNDLFNMGLVSVKNPYKTFYTIKDLTINYYSLINNELKQYTNDEDIINNLKGKKLQGSWYITVPNWVYTNSFEGKQIEINATKSGKLTPGQQFTIMEVAYMHFNANITDSKVSACSYASRMFALSNEETKDEGATLRQSINRLVKKNILIKISSINKKGLDVVLAEKPFNGVKQLAQNIVKTTTDSIATKQLDEATKQLDEATKTIEELTKQLNEAKAQIALLQQNNRLVVNEINEPVKEEVLEEATTEEEEMATFFRFQEEMAKKQVNDGIKEHMVIKEDLANGVSERNRENVNKAFAVFKGKPRVKTVGMLNIVNNNCSEDDKAPDCTPEQINEILANI